MSMERDVYLGRLKLHGSEHQATLAAASNYADSLHNLKRFDARRRRRGPLPLGNIQSNTKPQRQKLLVLPLGKRELDADDRVARGRAVQRDARDRRIFQFLL